MAAVGAIVRIDGQAAIVVGGSDDGTVVELYRLAPVEWHPVSALDPSPVAAPADLSQVNPDLSQRLVVPTPGGEAA